MGIGRHQSTFIYICLFKVGSRKMPHKIPNASDTTSLLSASVADLGWEKVCVEVFTDPSK